MFSRLGATTGLPVHWGTFRLSYEAWDTPPKMLAGVMRCRGYGGEPPFRARAIGEMFEVPPAQPPMPRPAAGDMAACLLRPEITGLP